MLLIKYLINLNLLVKEILKIYQIKLLLTKIYIIVQI